MIGVDAVEARLGGYSGPGNNKISILAGIKEKAGTSIRVSLCTRAGKRTQNMDICSFGLFINNTGWEEDAGIKGRIF